MAAPYIRHLRRVYQTPLLIEPGALDLLLPRLTDLLLKGKLETEIEVPADAQLLPYFKVTNQNGVRIGIIPVHGILVQRGRYDAATSTEFLGYDTLVRNVGIAVDDSATDVVALDLASPGGEVAGAFDAMRAISAFATQKPIMALVNEVACSSAYGIAAACTNVVIPETGIVGSVGVLMRHADLSVLYKNQGIQITELYAGARKVDGSSLGPLSKEARQKYEAELAVVYDAFTSLVGDFRNLSQANVRATEAATYMGQAAVTVGFADVVGSPNSALEMIMLDTPSTLLPTATSVDEPPSDSPDAQELSSTVAPETVSADARKAERERIQAILSYPGIPPGMKQAAHLAFETDLSAPCAIAILEAAPPVAESNDAGRIMREAMAAVGDSGVESLPFEAGPDKKTRAEFDKMSARDRAQFIKTGGLVV